MTARELVLHGGAVLDASGSFVDGLTVVARDGVISAVSARPPRLPDAEHVDLAEHLLMPGVIDCHTHLGWTRFDAADRDALPAAQRADEVRRGLAATLRGGVVRARDAGGADAALRDAVAAGSIPGPELAVSVDLLDGARLDTVDDVRRGVRRVLDAGADWVKLVATGGVGAPEGSELESTLTAEQFRTAVAEAGGRGARVLVHAWGGDAITDAIAAGVASIEHAVFLTPEQAEAAARARVTIVPTLAIYREVRAMADAGALPARLGERAVRVVAAHPSAVRCARDAGASIALGSDFGTLDQHGRNLAELGALADAGLGLEGALLAATRNGAALLDDRMRGALAPGRLLDAVVLDPAVLRAGADRIDWPDAVRAVYRGGRRVPALRDASLAGVDDGGTS